MTTPESTGRRCAKISTVSWGIFPFRKALRFLAAGSINTTVFYGIYSALIYLGLHYNLALFIDYAAGLGCGYLLNRHWTFSSGGLSNHSFVKYLATYLVVYLGNMSVLTLVVTGGLLDPYIGQLLSLAIVAALSFLLQNYWVFGIRNG
jgi:putative flippase GtrA